MMRSRLLLADFPRVSSPTAMSFIGRYLISLLLPRSWFARNPCQTVRVVFPHMRNSSALLASPIRMRKCPILDPTSTSSPRTRQDATTKVRCEFIAYEGQRLAATCLNVCQEFDRCACGVL
jgi:hypothetical protein